MLLPTDINKTFVVIPAFNEQEVIRDTIENILSFKFKVIVVDDGSAIPLSKVLYGFPATILTHAVNLGQGAALQTGIEYALEMKNAEYIITFDADGQHQSHDIEKLLIPLLRNEADITLGSRFLAGAGHNMPPGRKSLVKFARTLNYFFTGLLLSDAHNGLRAMNRKAASCIHLKQNGMSHATEILSIIKQKKLRYKEIPVQIQYTEYSKKKGQSAWGGFRIFFDILLNKIVK